MQLHIPGRPPVPLDRPRIMGIVNVTPDSFSDGGRYDRVDAAVTLGLAIAQAGAAIIDVGGESTRPGSQRTPAATQRDRVLPVIQQLRAALDDEGLTDVPISVDTTLCDVAGPALDAGAAMLNDVTAGRDDPALLALAAERGVPIALMHMQGTPATMQQAPRYENVVEQVAAFLLERAAAAEQAGVSQSRIVIDPGIGFGKTYGHNLALLGALDRFVATGYPVLLGASRKAFIATASPARDGSAPPAAERVGGTCAATALAAAAGVAIVRVHDVQPNRQAADVAWAVTRARG